MTVTERACAKVNLALHVIARRQDGYHELDSLVAFADIADVLEFEPAERLELVLRGQFASRLTTGSDNLVIRAARSLAGRVPGQVMAARITLTKNLPVASGLGGGSSDAAATLRGLLRLWGKTLPDETLSTLASELGADVPVCLHQQACRMQGIGERITKIGASVPRPAVLVTPGVELATASVFARLGLAKGEIFGQPLASPSNHAAWRNDLMTAAVSLAPEISDALSGLENQPGIVRALMSGSGASCYGIFESEDASRTAAARIAAAHPAWWVRSTILQ